MAVATARAAAGPLRAGPVKSLARSSRWRDLAKAAMSRRIAPMTPRDDCPADRASPRYRATASLDDSPSCQARSAASSAASGSDSSFAVTDKPVSTRDSLLVWQCYAAKVSYRHSNEECPLVPGLHRRVRAWLAPGQHEPGSRRGRHLSSLPAVSICRICLVVQICLNPRMSTDLSTPVLLRRIAQLEATVGRLSEDLGTLRSAVSKQGLQLPRTRGVRARVAHADSAAADNLHAQATGGLAGATARGEAARVQWVKDGLVVPGEQLAQAWGLTRQALAPAADRGEDLRGEGRQSAVTTRRHSWGWTARPWQPSAARSVTSAPARS
jgi:hypothetical protein